VNDDNSPNLHDCLVRVTGKVNEDVHGEPVSWDIGDHFGDAAMVQISLVTNTPGDLIGIASLRITLMGDGFYLISRTRVGGDSEFIASGKIDALEGAQHYGREYAMIHRALWKERQKT